MAIRRMFWDIETSPNIMFSWKSGYKLNLGPDNIIDERAVICICWKWEGEKKVHHLQWDDGCDGEMIKEFQAEILEADEMIAHNGDRFDLKWYNGRHLLHRLPPIPTPKTVDTLKIARKRFYLNSNRLDYLAKKLFGEGKIHTNFDLWKRCIKKTEPDADIREKNVTRMVRYCKKDALLVERVWNELRSYEPPSTHAAVFASGDDRDKWMCPHCGSPSVIKSKTRVTAKGSIQHQMRCNECGRYYSISNRAFDWYLNEVNGAGA